VSVYYVYVQISSISPTRGIVEDNDDEVRQKKKEREKETEKEIPSACLCYYEYIIYTFINV